MSLKKFYDSLPETSSPKTEFIDEVAKECNLTTGTIRNWVKGRALPKEKEYFEILSKKTGIPVEELFPQE